MLFKQEVHTRIYLAALLLLAAGLPLSIWLTSFAQVILALNWIAEGRFPYKLKLLMSRKSLLLFLMLYGLHLTGLIFTSDFSYAFYDLRIKLPVLILPVIIGTTVPLSIENLKILLLTFSGSTLIGTLASTAVFAGIIPYEYNDTRDLSLFISHIRFSLMVVFSVFILFYYANRKGPIFTRVVFLITGFWLILFMFIPKTITGLVIFMVIVPVVGWIYSRKINEIAPRFIVRVLLVTLPLIVFSFLSRSAGKFFYRETVDFSQLDVLSPNGNPYFHDTLSNQVENGTYVWLYLNENELREGWNARSSYAFDGKDKRKQDLKYTLIRYMSSKGLRKDKESISQLDSIDISAVERGLTNYIFLEPYSLYPRIYEILWEIDQYRQGNNPQGYSVAQRLLYLKAAFSIIREYPVFGTGTGDVQNEFNQYYKKNYPEISQRWRGRAHNQYVTFLLTFGIIGFIIAMASIFLPPWMEKTWRSYFFIVFFLIALLSMLNEDTLETHTGVSFILYFYSLLVFGMDREKPKH